MWLDQPRNPNAPLAGLKVVEFHKEQRNLEDAFIDMLGRIDRGEGALPAAAPKPVLPAFTPPESAN